MSTGTTTTTTSGSITKAVMYAIVTFVLFGIGLALGGVLYANAGELQQFQYRWIAFFAIVSFCYLVGYHLISDANSTHGHFGGLEMAGGVGLWLIATVMLSYMIPETWNADLRKLLSPYERTLADKPDVKEFAPVTPTPGVRWVRMQLPTDAEWAFVQIKMTKDQAEEGFPVAEKILTDPKTGSDKNVIGWYKKNNKQESHTEDL